MKAAKLVLVLIVACGVAAWFGWRAWQGPAVDVYEVRLQPLVQTVVATGRVVSTTRTKVGAEITGVVQERHVRDGDLVKPGDLLVSLKADELAAKFREAQAALTNLQQSRSKQANAALEQAKSQLEQAQREAQRRQDLLKKESISKEIVEKAVNAEIAAQANYRQAKLLADALAPGGPEEAILSERLAAAQAALQRTAIKAPFEAVVLTRDVEPGDLVQPGRTLMELAQIGKTEILVPVDERNLGVLTLGQKAICIPDAYPNRRFEAVVDHIAPTVDPQRGTVDVRLAVPNAPDYLRHDMTVTATIITGERNKTAVVPNDALHQIEGDQATVQVIDLGRVVEREVTLGLRGLTYSEVLKGLSSGTEVIRTPDLKPGQRVRAGHVD